jgi:hypothetical protein
LNFFVLGNEPHESFCRNKALLRNILRDFGFAQELWRSMQKMFLMGAFAAAQRFRSHTPPSSEFLRAPPNAMLASATESVGKLAAVSASSASNRAGDPTIKFSANVSPKFFSARSVERAYARLRGEQINHCGIKNYHPGVHLIREGDVRSYSNRFRDEPSRHPPSYWGAS